MANHGVAGTWRKACLTRQCCQSGAAHKPQQHAEMGDHAPAKTLDDDDQRYGRKA